MVVRKIGKKLSTVISYSVIST